MRAPNEEFQHDCEQLNHPLAVLMTCRVRDLPILEITVKKLPENLPCRAVYVVAPDQECGRIQKAVGSRVMVLPENEFIPGLKLEELRKMDLPGFPKQAGWYFQQFLKLQFAFLEPEEDFYLIWDADTIPLRAMHFFDPDGKMLLTKATEYHRPYFETYRRALGSEPNREFSFIAQHILVQKSVAREMLGRIEKFVPGDEPWAWKIMKALAPKDRLAAGNNLFSEYETYGHFIKNTYPERVRFIERAWFRENATWTGCPVPTQRQLADLAEKYDYAAFERVSRGWRRFTKVCLGKLRNR